jgi:hypothetical protein
MAKTPPGRLSEHPGGVGRESFFQSASYHMPEPRPLVAIERQSGAVSDICLSGEVSNAFSIAVRTHRDILEYDRRGGHAVQI